MAAVSGGKVILESRAGVARGARKTRQARRSAANYRDVIVVPVRERDCARSGPAPDEFKLFKKSAKWFLQDDLR